MQGLIVPAFVFSILAMLASLACLVIMLAKNYFSSHVIQYQPPPMPNDLFEGFSKEMGKAMGSPFREIDDPIDDQELEHLEELRRQQQKPKQTPNQPV